MKLRSVSAVILSASLAACSGGSVTPAQAPAQSPSTGSAHEAGMPLIAAPTDDSWSLREREQWARLVRYTQAELDDMNRTCGTRIEGAFVFETFRGRFVPANEYGISDQVHYLVQQPIHAVKSICRDGEMQKDAVRRKIQRIEVRCGAPSHSTWGFAGSVLTGTVNPVGESEQGYFREISGPEGLRRLL